MTFEEEVKDLKERLDWVESQFRRIPFLHDAIKRIKGNIHTLENKMVGTTRPTSHSPGWTALIEENQRLKDQTTSLAQQLRCMEEQSATSTETLSTIDVLLVEFQNFVIEWRQRPR